MRLLRRLQSGRARDAASGNISALLESVRDNIKWLLNTRQGDSLSSPEYGMPDLSAVIAGLPSSERPFCEAIEVTVREHEPRVSWVRVTLEDVEPVAKATRSFTIEITLKASSTGRPHISGSVDLDANFKISA